MSVRIPGLLYAALQVCHPASSLPDWLLSRAPRCATGAAVQVPEGQEQAEQLADLVALAWWECLQDDGTNPFTHTFAAACAQHLAGARLDPPGARAAHSTLSEGRR